MTAGVGVYTGGRLSRPYIKEEEWVWMMQIRVRSNKTAHEIKLKFIQPGHIQLYWLTLHGGDISHSSEFAFSDEYRLFHHKSSLGENIPTEASRGSDSESRNVNVCLLCCSSSQGESIRMRKKGSSKDSIEVREEPDHECGTKSTLHQTTSQHTTPYHTILHPYTPYYTTPHTIPHHTLHHTTHYTHCQCISYPWCVRSSSVTESVHAFLHSSLLSFAINSPLV